MARWTLRTAGAALTILLAGCGSAADDAQGVTPREAQALNEAAAMLDDNGQDAVIVSNDTAPDAPDNTQ